MGFFNNILFSLLERLCFWYFQKHKDIILRDTMSHKNTSQQIISTDVGRFIFILISTHRLLQGASMLSFFLLKDWSFPLWLKGELKTRLVPCHPQVYTCYNFLHKEDAYVLTDHLRHPDQQKFLADFPRHLRSYWDHCLLITNKSYQES